MTESIPVSGSLLLVSCSGSLSGPGGLGFRRVLASPSFQPPERSAVRPNHSLEPTSSGKRRKPGVRQSNYRHTPGLRRSPPGSAQLER
jgi:hypothetical protein